MQWINYGLFNKSTGSIKYAEEGKMTLTSYLNMKSKTKWLLGENVDQCHDMEDREDLHYMEKKILTGHIKEKEW